MSSLFADTHNVVAILEKSDAAEGFEQIIDFLSGSYIHYALTVSPPIYISCIKQFWNSVSVKRSGDVTRLQALVDKKKIVIFEAVIREILQLNDAEGVVCLPNEEIFAGLAQMGYEKSSTKLTFYKAFFSSQWKFLIHTILQSLSAKRTSWNEFSTAMASAVICLSKGQRFNFSKYIFDSLVPNVDNNSKFYMVGKGFSRVETPLFESMLVIKDVAKEAEAQVLATCSALALRVEGLENDKAAQQLEIVKIRAKGRIIFDMNEDKGIEMVADQEKDAEFEGRHADKQAEIYNIDLDHSSKVLSMQKDDTEVQEAIEIVTTSKLMTEVVTVAATQVATASTPIPAAKPKILTITAAPAVSTRRRKEVVIRDPEEELHSDTLAETPKIEMDAEYARKLQEEINKEHEESYKNIDWNAALDHVQSKEPQYIKRYHRMKKKPQTKCKGKKYDEILPIFQAKFDANMRFLFKSREEMEAEDEEIIKSINETPAQKAAKRRKLSEEAQEAEDLRKRLEIVQDEDDDVFVEATPLAQKVPVVDYQIVVIDNKPRYKIKRADDTHQLYISFTTLLKNFDREDLEALWKIVRDRFSTSKPTNFSDEYLLLTLKTMFKEPNGQDAIWRNQKSVHVQLFLLVERRYPLSRFTLKQLVNVERLQVEEESEMSLELLSKSKDCQSNIDAASLRLKLFKDVAAVADAK
nr:hypothetical protein [Tanacetum cinerariifolium]